MEYRHLGKSGLEVSVVGLGCNNFGPRTDEASAARVIDRAIDLGITFLDTSNTYGNGTSETFIGNALKGAKRNQVILATKAGWRMHEGPNGWGAGRKHLIENLDASLKRLQTDCVDLFQVHRPDYVTPPEETMQALDMIVQAGKARYVGCSNYPAWFMCEAMWTAKTNGWIPLVSAQPEYNMLNRSVEREISPFCEKYGMSIIPFYPLAGGFLTGKYKQGQPPPEGTRGARGNFRWLTDQNYAMLGKLDEFATKRGHAIGELAIAWLLHRPAVDTVIAGATKPEQVDDNAKAAEWKLSKEDMDEIDVILSGAKDLEGGRGR